MSPVHPFQKICYIKESGDSTEILLAASGSQICFFNIKRGNLLARWHPGSGDDDGAPDDGEKEPADRNGGSERPRKRQKLSNDLSDPESRRSSEESVKILAERVKGKRRKLKVVSAKLPSVSHMVTTFDGRYVVTVTTDDKCIRVLQIEPSGRLNTLSERCMPKRLCAIALTGDERTIVAGDKFGDVYSLPLLPVSQPGTSSTADRLEPVPEFKPSATELTVHTKGNLEALRQQLQQQPKSIPKKEAPSFEHKLLLGHVSLLTDLAIAEVNSHLQPRQYILTSDRDEHIRVSRGLSQSHIIETYCLGHKDFVSKLRLLPWRSDILLAGSGEPSLKLYHWDKGHLIGDTLFSGTAMTDVMNILPASASERSLDRLAVSGIWAMQDFSEPRTARPVGYLLVALEGLPILLSYFVNEDGIARHHQTLHFAANVLDVAVAEGRQSILVSVDTVHESGSMKRHRTEPLPVDEAICSFELVDIPISVEKPGNFPPSDNLVTEKPWWKPSCLLQSVAKILTEEDLGALVEMEEVNYDPKSRRLYSKLGEFLYGLENLRKKRGQEAQEADQEAEYDGHAAVKVKVE